MHVFAFYGTEWEAIEPDPGFVATGAEGDLEHRVLIVVVALRQDKLPLIPGYNLVFPAGG